MAIIPTDFVLRGLVAARPAAGVAGRIYVATDGGAQRITYDDGAVWQDVDVDPPYAPGAGAEMQGFTVYLAADIVYNFGQRIPFDTVDYDPDGIWVVGTKNAIIPAAGLWRFDINLWCPDAAGIADLQQHLDPPSSPLSLYTVAAVKDVGNAQWHATASFLLRCAVGDVVSTYADVVAVGPASNTLYGGTQGCNLSATYVGPTPI